MMNTQIIDVAITLCFTYLLYATIVSTLVEIINTVTKARAKMLKKSIENLLFSDDWKKLRSGILKSPYIQALQKSKKSFPSYIPARNFALAVLDSIKENYKINNEGIRLSKNIEDTLNKLPVELKPLLINAVSKSENQLETISESIENFYNDAMDRVSGWFKRRSQIITFIISLALAVGFNVDSVRITKTLWQDKPSLEKATNLAINYVNKQDSINEVILKINLQNSVTQDTLIRKILSETGNIKQTLLTLNEIPIPIGWISENFQEQSLSLKYWLIKISGLLLTTIAIYLGAPFWFDLLNKFVNIRGSFKKPEDKKPDK